ncbi:hypothetical protein DMN91_006086 [Ooceraea biroi]|uniref:Cilia- and flagella-associated protein 45 n=2 Tax=Ooceraea biroi TaxID=2015173 RepID=A0A3L8DMQ9_OOCBI|nr:hypothetical protein DMN91_006086 [Ooceraea biroi]
MLTKTIKQKPLSGNADYRGNSKLNSSMCIIRASSAILNVKPIYLKGSNVYKKKEIDKTSDKRECLIPSKPIAYSRIVTQKEYEHLKERSHVITKEEKQMAVETEEKEKERLTKESIERKEAIRRMDMKKRREKDPRTREIEEEARKKMMHILERARNMRLEQEEEIQECNRLILATKCRAIRDAQIAEKKLIEREVLEEEKRLNNMMEDERRWAIKEELRKEQEEASKRSQFAKLLKEQIVTNEEQRIIEFERRQEESRLINLNNVAQQQDEIEKMRNKEAENARIRQELMEGHEQLKYFKAMRQEEDRIIDLSIQNYHRIKEEKEAKKVEEQKLEKLRKEREKARVATQTIQAHELQMHIDEINAIRIQEEVEREWRLKEKEEMLKKLNAQKMLWKEREEQINNKRIMQAIEIERDRREFEKIVCEQETALDREKKELEQKQEQTLIHRNEILKQINEKERERITERQKMFEENLTTCAETAMRKKKLQDVIEQKWQKMREDNVPDTYINEVKRMIENIH